MPVRRGKEKTASLSRGTFLFLAGLVVLADQFTKVLAQTFLISGASLPILGNFFHLTLVQNEGIAFGLFQGAEKTLLVIIPLSIVGLVFFGLRSHPGRWMTQGGIGLILGGAVGNWIDRIRVGAVIDFLDFRIWPVFNFADTAITVGVGLFLLELLKKPNRVS